MGAWLLHRDPHLKHWDHGIEQAPSGWGASCIPGFAPSTAPRATNDPRGSHGSHPIVTGCAFSPAGLSLDSPIPISQTGTQRSRDLPKPSL